MLELIKKQSASIIITTLAFIVGLLWGQNQGLRNDVSATISSFKQVVSNLQNREKKWISVIERTAQRDSTARIIIQQEIDRANK